MADLIGSNVNIGNDGNNVQDMAVGADCRVAVIKNPARWPGASDNIKS